jgi:hypothetical protein
MRTRPTGRQLLNRPSSKETANGTHLKIDQCRPTNDNNRKYKEVSGGCLESSSKQPQMTFQLKLLTNQTYNMHLNEVNHGNEINRKLNLGWENQIIKSACILYREIYFGNSRASISFTHIHSE